MVTGKSHTKGGHLYEKGSSPFKVRIISVILKVIAWIIYIGGFIAGIIMAEETVPVLGEDYYTSEFSVGIAFTYWFGHVIFGMPYFTKHHINNY